MCLLYVHGGLHENPGFEACSAPADHHNYSSASSHSNPLHSAAVGKG